MKFSKADLRSALCGLLGVVCAVMEHMFASEIVVETPLQGIQDVVRCSKSPHWEQKDHSTYLSRHAHEHFSTLWHLQSSTASNSDFSDKSTQKMKKNEKLYKGHDTDKY